MELLILFAILVIGLIMIPFGLPGTWVMVAGAFGYQLLLPDSGIGLFTVVGTTVLAVIAEVVEFMLGGTYARKYGGSKRAAWGAIIGGMIGVIMGVPIPILGSVIGGFVGAFVGALVAELSRGTDRGAATKAAWGALVGRAVATAMKVAVGVVIAGWIVMAALTQ